MRMSLSGLLVLVLGVPVVAEDAPPSDRSVCTEVRVLKVSAGFCERMGLSRDGGQGLSDREFRAVMEAAQGDRDASVMQCPKVTADDGQATTVRVGDQRFFVTGVEAKKVNGVAALVPKNTPVDLGYTVKLCGTVSADGKFVKLKAGVTHTTVGRVELLPVATQVTPVYEGGSQGKPITFTQYLEAPDVKTMTVEKTVVVPAGGTMVLGGWAEPAAEFGPPALSKIPYINRLYKNVGPRAGCEVLVLATTRVVTCDAPECGPQPRAVAPTAPPASVSEVRKMRNVAAADAAAAVGKRFVGRNAEGVVVAAEPVSNAVLVSGERALVAQACRGLAALDVAPPQTMIQALVMEVPAGWLADIGLAEEVGKPVVLSARELAMLQAAIRRQKEKGDIDILSRPQMQVADNQTGFAQVGGQVPMYAGLELVASPQGGLTVARKTEQAFQGVCLAVTPRMEPKDGTVMLCVKTEWTSVSPAAVKMPLTLPPEVTGLKEPVTYQLSTVGARNVQSMQTTVAGIRDGQSLILSGGVRKEEGEVRRETLIVLTPHLVKADAVRPAAHAVPAPPPVAPAPPALPLATPAPVAPAVLPAPQPTPFRW